MRINNDCYARLWDDWHQIATVICFRIATQRVIPHT